LAVSNTWTSGSLGLHSGTYVSSKLKNAAYGPLPYTPVKVTVGSIHDPTDAMGKLLFTTLAMIAEFEADLTRMRTREGMKVAEAKGRLRGKAPKLSAKHEAHLVALHKAGEHTSTELGELFGVARSTVYRAIERAAIKS